MVETPILERITQTSEEAISQVRKRCLKYGDCWQRIVFLFDTNKELNDAYSYLMARKIDPNIISKIEGIDYIGTIMKEDPDKRAIFDNTPHLVIRKKHILN